MKLATWAKEDMRAAWTDLKTDLTRDPIAVIGVVLCSIVVAYLMIAPFLMD
jgi:hypothetical protein